MFLQEHWLHSDELAKLNNVHPNFNGIGVSAIDTSSGMLIARPFGGVAGLWRDTLSEHTNQPV